LCAAEGICFHSLADDLVTVPSRPPVRKNQAYPSDSKPRYIAATPCDACVRNHDECHIRTGDRWILRCKTCNRTNRKKCSLEDQVRQEYYHLMKVQSSIFVDIYDDWVSREVKLGKMIASSNGGTGSHAVYYHFKSHQEIGSRLRKFARICQELCNLASKLDKLPRSQARFYSSLMERHDLMWEQDRQTPLSVAVLKSSEGGSTSSHAFNHPHDDESGRGNTIRRDEMVRKGRSGIRQIRKGLQELRGTSWRVGTDVGRAWSSIFCLERRKKASCCIPLSQSGHVCS
jgi:hypothetical protein